MKIALCLLALPVIIAGILLKERGHTKSAITVLAMALCLLGAAAAQPW